LTTTSHRTTPHSQESIMQLPRIITCASEGTIGRWQYHYDWRSGLFGLVVALGLLVLAARGDGANDGAVALAIIIAGTAGYTWRRITPTTTRPNRDSDHAG
jgi:hypothetical protein